jgi:hypothetical protein
MQASNYSHMWREYTPKQYHGIKEERTYNEKVAAEHDPGFELARV